MSTFDLNRIIRENIKRLIPYSSARSEYDGVASVFLDANENSIGSASGNRYNRYPDPLQKKLKEKISKLKQIPTENIFLGNGSDEPIDLLIRATCEPGKDNILIFPPTYGMYEVAARINDVAVKKILLTVDFQLDLNKIVNEIDDNTKLIFICSPNNPTGNLLNEKDIITLIENFSGIIVIDEAYIDFTSEKSWLQKLDNYPNVVILQTFSKAWGLAALRMGCAYASAAIIEILNKIKAPYNINLLSQEAVLNALTKEALVEEWITQINEQRFYLSMQLRQFSFIECIYPSCANFILIRVKDANCLYDYLLKQNIVVRNRSSMPLCDNCLRITVGTPSENSLLLNAFKNYLS
ncbi:MAG TPA: histidinol-phosphate transaminase [Flavipsychrobacter sp.]|nr:histidinol-phosphate transaminase [Flavipsychrobacter sp.]